MASKLFLIHLNAKIVIKSDTFHMFLLYECILLNEAFNDLEMIGKRCQTSFIVLTQMTTIIINLLQNITLCLGLCRKGKRRELNKSKISD